MAVTPTVILRQRTLVVAGVVSLVRDVQDKVALDRDDPVRGVQRKPGRVRGDRVVRGGQPGPEVRVHPEKIRRQVLSSRVSKLQVYRSMPNHVAQEGQEVLVRRVRLAVQVRERVVHRVRAARRSPGHPQELGLVILDPVRQENHQENRVQAPEGMTGNRAVRPHMSPSLALPSRHEAVVNCPF